MVTFLVSYIIVAAVFLALDAAWLTTMAATYRSLIGDLMADSFRLGPAAAFYLLYVAGVVGFAVMPALHQGSWQTAALKGAFLGLIAYGTYDLTNQATLKAWPLRMTMIDMAWGTFATALTASIATIIAAKYLSSTN